jgi:hypothetical protein
LDNSILSRFKRIDNVRSAISSGSDRVIIYSPERRALNYWLNKVATSLEESGVRFGLNKSSATIKTESILIVFSSDASKLRGYEIGTPIVMV